MSFSINKLTLNEFSNCFLNIDSSVKVYLKRSWVWLKDTYYSRIQTLVNYLFNYFDIFNPSTFRLNTFSPLSFRKINVINTQDHITHAPLVNLGSTCYINSCLNLIAKSNNFNTLFTKELADSNENNLDIRNALQSNLSNLINKIRMGISFSNISYNELKRFFTLCQAAGWHQQAKTACIQSDASEFLEFLINALEFDSMHYQRFTKQVDNENNKPLIDYLVPSNGNYCDDSPTDFHQSQPTPLIIVNLSRAIFSRTLGTTRATSRVHLPTTIKFDQNDPKVSFNDQTYKLIGAISHYSKHASGGHYYAITALNDQKFVKYDDNKQPQLLESLEDIESTCTTLLFELENI